MRGKKSHLTHSELLEYYNSETDTFIHICMHK